MKKIFETIESLTPEYIEVFKDIVSIESPSVCKERVDEAGNYFIAIAEKNGWEIDVKEYEEYGNVVTITMNPDAPGEMVTLSGHLDTVHPVGSFGEKCGKIEGDILYGPGAMDCKGGVVAGFLAMQALAQTGFSKRPVRMILQSNEEIGSHKTSELLKEKAKGSVAFLNLEGREDFFANKACLIRKGIALLTFDITGIATHASYCAKEGASAILEAAHKIIELEKIKDHEGITINCGVVAGGLAPNAVAASCRIKIDVRFSTAKQQQEAMEYIQKVAETNYVPGCTTKMTLGHVGPAFEPSDRNFALLERCNEIFAANGLSKLEVGVRTGASDAAHVSSAGIPTIDSLGIRGERMHSVEEHALLSSLPESAKRLATIVALI